LWALPPTLTKKQLFEIKRICLLLGPIGTGKTTLQAYLVDHLLNQGNYTAHWLVFKSVKKYFDRELDKSMPKAIRNKLVTTSNPNDTLIWWNDKDKTEKEILDWISEDKILIGDEIARFMDRYSNPDKATRRFGHLVASLRQKGSHGIFADQGFDFPVATKEKATLWFFTGATDFVMKKLQDSSTSRLAYWLNYNAPKLVEIGYFNNINLKKPDGWGIAIITNGFNSWTMYFKRPSWYTYELSTVLKYLKPDDIGDLVINEGKSYDLESDLFKCLLFAYHYMLDKQFKKPSNDMLNDLFFMASPIFYNGKRTDLPGNGRAFLRKAVAICKTKECPYCSNPTLYRDKLQELVDYRSYTKPRTSGDLQQEITELVGCLPD